MRSRYALALLVPLLLAFPAAARADTRIYLGIQFPVFESPALSVPPANPGIAAEFGNFFTDLFERFGGRIAIYPISASSVRLGVAGDFMWHYDIETSRAPTIMGNTHLGLMPTMMIDLGTTLFAQGGFGINRMGYRLGDAGTFGNGTVAELSLGLRLGSDGRGFALEGAFQNRTGLGSIRYWLLRGGFLF